MQSPFAHLTVTGLPVTTITAHNLGKMFLHISIAALPNFKEPHSSYTTGKSWPCFIIFPKFIYFKALQTFWGHPNSLSNRSQLLFWWSLLAFFTTFKETALAFKVFIPQVLMFVTIAFLSNHCFPSCASSSEPVTPWKTILGHVSYHHNVYLPYSPLFNPSIKSLYQGRRKHFRIGQAMKFFQRQSIHFTLVTVHPLQVTHNTIAMKSSWSCTHEVFKDYELMGTFLHI